MTSRTLSTTLCTTLCILCIGLQDGHAGSPNVTSNKDEFYIVNAHSSKCLDVNGSSRSDGAAILQYRCHGGDNQRWIFNNPGGSAHLVSAAHSNGKVLDVPSSDARDGVALQQFTVQVPVQDNQTVEAHPLVPDRQLLQLIMRHSGKCLTVPSGSHANSVHVVQDACTGGTNQQWMVVPAF